MATIPITPIGDFMKILNLTQHPATPEQIEQGVFDVPEAYKKQLTELLTFTSRPTRIEVMQRANALALFADHFNPAGDVMIGGAPFLMFALHERLEHHCMTPYYAFSERVSIEEPQDDGSVRKTNIFKHVGFV